MRQWLEGCSVPRTLNVDKDVVFLLSGTGPRFMKASVAHRSEDIRRVGYTYYDGAFADQFLRAAVLEYGRMRPTRRALLQLFPGQGNEVAMLLPANVRGWLDLLEDVLAAPPVHQLEDALIGECVEHKEFWHMAMDCTVRIAMPREGPGELPRAQGIWVWCGDPSSDSVGHVLCACGICPLCPDILCVRRCLVLLSWVSPHHAL